MTRIGSTVILTSGVVLILSTRLAAQQPSAAIQVGSAAEALEVLLERNIRPAAGPLTSDGATIAGVLAGQSLTFPMASSSGAFVTIPLAGFGPRIPVSASGSFGPLFAERALTNGRRNLSLSFHYQHKTWRSISGINLRGFELKGRSVFRDNISLGPEGTAEEFAADIDFQTDVFVLAANYGVFDSLDVGLSLPYVRSTVNGVKQRTRAFPQRAPVVITQQSVSGVSQGIGDAIVRVKYRIRRRGNDGRGGGTIWATRLQTAVGYDLRLPTGSMAQVPDGCEEPPCKGLPTREVPDVVLGQRTHKWSVFLSSVFGRVSPHVNAGYVLVPSYRCSAATFGGNGRCRGTIFTADPLNGIQDAKNQNLSNEWNVTTGVDYQMQPFRSTLSIDVIGRQLIRAGQFYQGPARLMLGDGGPSQSVSTRVESRHGNVNTLVGVIGAKVGLRQRWVVAGNLIFPLNSGGLQPNAAWVIGLERALAR
jgi:hypothetical protein